MHDTVSVTVEAGAYQMDFGMASQCRKIVTISHRCPSSLPDVYHAECTSRPVAARRAR
jgi:hypothetical protein